MNRKKANTGIKLFRARIKIFCDSERSRIYCHANCEDVLQSVTEMNLLFNILSAAKTGNEYFF